MKKLALSLALAAVLGACSQPQNAAPPPPAPAAKVPADQPAAPPPPKSAVEVVNDRMTTILAGPWRSDANKARDVYRHPQETLGFFGLKAGQTVIEMLPGGGWYTEILGPLYKGQGKLIAAIPDASTAPSDRAKNYLAKGNTDYKAKLAGDAEHFGEIEVREFSLTAPKLGEPNSADVVVTFRNVHNFVMWGDEKEMFKAMFEVLKPGGTLGVEDHRAAAGADLAKVKDTGYLPEDYVIKLATDAGFALVDKSEINANPKDTKDYESGVWTLPPTYALKDKDHDKYAAIGESDRMTLKFVKPATSDKVFDNKETPDKK